MNAAPKQSTLLARLLLQYPNTPKVRAKQWILAGRVSIGGVISRKPHALFSDADGALELRDRHATTLDCGPGWQIHPRVSLLYLDSSLAVVNKGPGLISVPAPNADLSALSILADFLAGKLKAREKGVAGRTLPPPYRRLDPLPVHRLDQFTSGVFCMATNPDARRILIEQLQARTMGREYIAYVEGRPAAPKGTWRQWLQLSKDELRQDVLSPSQAKAAGDAAQEAITHYEVIGEYTSAGARGAACKLRLRLETGRKHQIRAQAAYAGLPLIGDRKYNPRYRAREAANLPADFPRQALHAEVLHLEHPAQPGRRMTWKAASPRDLSELENALRNGHFDFATHVSR